MDKRIDILSSFMMACIEIVWRISGRKTFFGYYPEM
jgi:hypothetical protein